MDQTHDLNLWQKIRHDDRKSLNDLFARHYSSLCRFASGYVGRTEAEEIVADIFFHLWSNRSALNIERSVKAYLFTSVRYACLKSIGKISAPMESIDDVDDHGLISPFDPQQHLFLNELEHRLHHAISQLPPRCAQVFVMNRFDGLTYKEIASILSIAEKTVENLIVKALQLLREKLVDFRFTV